MSKTKSQIRSTNKYDKKTYKRILILLRKDVDADIIDYLAEIKERDNISPSQLFKFCARKEIEDD